MKGQRPALGIALILVMAACFAVSDTTIKYLIARLPILFVLWARYAFQALAMAIWLARDGRAGFRSQHPKFQAVRGALLLATSAIALAGLKRMPVAEFTALGMLTPVVVTMLAAWVLHEHVSAPRWVLVCGGFAGALIVIRPGSGAFGWVALYPLAMAVCYGAFQIVTSRLGSLEGPYTTHFYTGLAGTAALTPFLIPEAESLLAAARAISLTQVLLVLEVGALTTAGHLFLIFAFGLAPMATLMPFIYAQIAFAVVGSWLVFRHVPDGWAWVGMAVIAACGAASAWLNVRSARTPPSPVAADMIAD